MNNRTLMLLAALATTSIAGCRSNADNTTSASGDSADASYYRNYVATGTGVATNSPAADVATRMHAPGFDNGGFEWGYPGPWIMGDNGLMPLEPWRVCQSNACGWFRNNQPVEGAFDASNGFDGDAGYEAFLTQNIFVAPETPVLHFADRIQYDGLGIPSFKARVYEVQVRDGNNQVLTVLHRQEVMLNGAKRTDLGWQKRKFDLSRFAGTAVRIYIRLAVPETRTGPAQIEFDAFALKPVAVVSGCVQEAGRPLANREVSLFPYNGMSEITRTDPQGCYEFFGPLPKGTPYDVVVRNPNPTLYP